MTLRDDADLAASFADDRVFWQAYSDLLVFLDGHGTRAHYQGDHLSFEVPSENQGFAALATRLMAAEKVLRAKPAGVSP